MLSVESCEIPCKRGRSEEPFPWELARKYSLLVYNGGPNMCDIHFELGERITVVQQFPKTDILEKTK